MSEALDQTRGELEALAQTISKEVGASESPRENALVILAKGLTDSLGMLMKGKAMAKDDSDVEDKDDGAGKKDNEEEDGKSDEAGAEDKDADTDSEDKEDDDKDEGGAGYEDMRMSAVAPDAPATEFVDATDFLAQIQTTLESMQKSMAKLSAENAQIRAEMAKRDEDQRLHVGAVLTEMSKGVLGIHGQLLKQPMVPASAMSVGALGKLRVVRESLDATLSDSGVTPEQMYKALSTKIITEDEYRLLKTTNTLDNAELLAKVKAL